MNPRLYLDHAATTPLGPEAGQAMARGWALWANPSSPHAEGRAARAALESARRQIGEALGWAGEVILTASATEAAQIALGQARVAGLMVGATEHASVHRLAANGGHRVEILPVGGDGRVDLHALAQRLAGVREQAGGGGPVLVALQAVNSETGVIQPLKAIGDLCRTHGALWLCDAAQAAGKMPLPDADFLVVAAHKLGGPVGAAALLVRDLASLRPGGGQEQGYRAGTENLPAILGFAAALRAGGGWLDRAAALRKRMETELSLMGAGLIAADAPRLPTIGAIRMPGVSAAAQLIRFDLAGIAVSAGSACSSGTLKTSPVLAAMGVPPEQAAEVIRVSLGRETEAAGVDRFLACWRGIAHSGGPSGARGDETAP